MPLRYDETVHHLEDQFELRPDVAIILGSGCHPLADEMDIEFCCPYGHLPYFPPLTVEHHRGEFKVGLLNGKPLMVFDGRYHLYEGHSPKEITHPVYLAKKLGCSKIILTNAAGSVNPLIKPGRVMMITDQLNLTGQSPLTGINDYRIGPRFPSLHQVYSHSLQELIETTAVKCNVLLEKGVYAGICGPETETPAECAMIRSFGADVIGMSTVLEAVAATHAGLEVAGLSLITDSIATATEGALKPTEAVKAAKRASKELNKLIKKLVEKLCVKPISNR